MFLRLLMCALVLAGCVPSDLLDQRPCPCLEGWSCNNENICVRGEVPDGGAPEADASVLARTCWRTGSVCDWSDESAFDLVEDDGSVFAEVDGINYVYSPDGCTILYGRDRDLFFARRAGPDMPFRAEQPFELNTGAFEDRASISPDGLELLFLRRGDDVFHVFRSRRTSTLSAWPTGVSVDPLNEPGLNTFDLTLSPRGQSIYFARRASPELPQEIFVADRPSLDSEFGAPRVLTELELGPGGAAEPSVAFGETLLTLVTNRESDDEPQLYFSTRESTDDAWGPLRYAPGAFLEGGGEQEGPLSPDGCEVLAKRDNIVHRLIYVPR